jgi:hypothetical protein
MRDAIERVGTAFTLTLPKLMSEAELSSLSAREIALVYKDNWETVCFSEIDCSDPRLQADYLTTPVAVIHHFYATQIVNRTNYDGMDAIFDDRPDHLQYTDTVRQEHTLTNLTSYMTKRRLNSVRVDRHNAGPGIMSIHFDTNAGNEATFDVCELYLAWTQMPGRSGQLPIYYPQAEEQDAIDFAASQKHAAQSEGGYDGSSYYIVCRHYPMTIADSLCIQRSIWELSDIRERHIRNEYSFSEYIPVVRH